MNSTVVSFFSQFEFFNDAVKSLSETLGFNTYAAVSLLVFLVAATVLTIVCATIGGLGTYAERKISADIQARVGPNRVGPYGLLQPLADALKLLTKEDIFPANADKFMFYLAPFLCVLGVFTTLAVLPVSSGLTLTHLNVGVFYIIAVSSLVGVGVFLGGYASNSKWSMLGGMRGASQIISYEVPITISIIAIVVLSGGMSFEKIVSSQGGLPHQWFIFHNPFTFIGFFIFFVSGLAETNRAPFDLPEAESELVSGYHTEYTGMRFALFALAEYVEIFVLCAVASTLFLGGYQLPLPETIVSKMPAAAVQLWQTVIFFIKALALYYVVIWVRWTLPRIRVDRLMSICWKVLTPFAIFNLIGVSIWMVVFKGESLLKIIFH